MNKFIVAVFLLVMPLLVWADYDPARIKKDIELDNTFQISGWELSDGLEGIKVYTAKTELPRATITVNKISSVFFVGMSTKEEFQNGIRNCMKFGQVGSQAKTEFQINQIRGPVYSATQAIDTSFDTVLNDVLFKVRVMDFSNVFIALMCQITVPE